MICKRCEDTCHCGNGCECSGEQCDCKDCDCKSNSLRKSIKVLSDIDRKRYKKYVVFEPDFSLTEH